MTTLSTAPSAKAFRRLVVQLRYYWSAVDINRLQLRELTAALNPEELLRLLGLDTETLPGLLGLKLDTEDTIIARNTAIRVLATMHIRGVRIYQLPKEVQHAEEAIRCLNWHLLTQSCRSAMRLFPQDFVPAQQVTHDPAWLRQLQIKAILLVWCEQHWDRDWHRWCWLKSRLDDNGIALEEVGITADDFDRSYRHAVIAGWAPELMSRVQRGSGSLDALRQYMGSGAAIILLDLIHDGWLTWQQAPCTSEELTELVKGFNQFPHERADFMSKISER